MHPRVGVGASRQKAPGAGANEGKSRQSGRGLRRQRLARVWERRFKGVELSAVLA